MQLPERYYLYTLANIAHTQVHELNLSITLSQANTVRYCKMYIYISRIITTFHTIYFSVTLHPTHLKWYLVMNLVRIWIWLNPHIMILEVIINHDSILDFPKSLYIFWVLAIQNVILGFQCTLLFFKMVVLWCHRPISLQNGLVMTSPANQLANKKVHWNPRAIFQMANTQNMWTFWKFLNPHLILYINCSKKETQR